MLGNHVYVVALLEFLGVVRAQLFNGKIVVAAAHLKYLKTEFGRLLANDGTKLFCLNQVVISAGGALGNYGIGHNRGKKHRSNSRGYLNTKLLIELGYDSCRRANGDVQVQDGVAGNHIASDAMMVYNLNDFSIGNAVNHLGGLVMVNQDNLVAFANLFDKLRSGQANLLKDSCGFLRKRAQAAGNIFCLRLSLLCLKGVLQICVAHRCCDGVVVWVLMTYDKNLVSHVASSTSALRCAQTCRTYLL